MLLLLIPVNWLPSCTQDKHPELQLRADSKLAMSSFKFCFLFSGRAPDTRSQTGVESFKKKNTVKTTDPAFDFYDRSWNPDFQFKIEYCDTILCEC